MTDRDLTRAEVEALMDGTTQAPQGPWWRIGPTLAAQLLRCMDERDEYKRLAVAGEITSRLQTITEARAEAAEATLKTVLNREAETYVRLENKIEAAEAENARLTAVEGERAARICEALHRKGVLPEKWPDYFRVREAGDALLAAVLKPAPTVTAGWPTEEGEGSIIVGNVKGDSHD
jgi:hypothetical protein